MCEKLSEVEIDDYALVVDTRSTMGTLHILVQTNMSDNDQAVYIEECDKDGDPIKLSCLNGWYKYDEIDSIFKLIDTVSL